MSKIINCVKVELILLRRSIWSYLILFCSLIYFGKQSFDLVQRYEPGQTLNFTAYIVQALIFLFLIYGILLAKQETSDDSIEVFKTIPNAWGNKILGKLIHIILLVLVFCATHLALLFILFSLHHVPGPFYYSSFLYILLYWTIPFIFCGVIGLILGITMKSKLVFPVMMIMGIFIGPLNQIVFISIVKMLPVWLQKLMFVINMGQSDPFRAYHIVYGLPLEEFRWVSKLYLLLIGVTILFSIIFYKQNHKFRGLIIVTSAGLTVIFGTVSWKAVSPHLNELTSKQAINSDDSYYKEKTITNYNSGNNFIIKQYNMNVSINNGLKNTVDMNIELKSTTNKLVFSLYHNFIVKSVRYLGKDIPFKQDIDYLIVSFPNPLNEGNYDLNIEYEGYGPQRFFSNQQAVMLPGFLSWYPVPGTQPVARFIDKYMADFYSYKSAQSAEFSLKYSGPKPLFTNLEYQSNGIWRGKSSSGITLVSGAMEEININNVDIFRPYALYNMSDHLSEDISSLNELYRDISQQFGGNYQPITKLFLLETRLNQSKVWLEDGYCIIDMDIMSNSKNAFVQGEMLVQQLLEGVVRNYNWDAQDRRMRELYVSSYSYWYQQTKYHTDKAQTYLIQVLSNTINNYYTDYISTYQNLIAFMDANISHQEKLSDFFNEWAAQMRGQGSYGTDQLDELITKFSKE